MRFSALDPKRNALSSLKCSGFEEIPLRLLRKMNFATSTIAGLQSQIDASRTELQDGGRIEVGFSSCVANLTK